MRLHALLLILFIGLELQAQFIDETATHNFLAVGASPLFGNGVAAADYDGDGDIDIYVSSEKDSPDQLYRNDNGQFVPIGENVGLGSMKRSRMALWLDIDGDRDLDLLVAGDCHLDADDCDQEILTRLYRQDEGQFTEVTNASGLREYGAKNRIERIGGLAAADINGDGYVDFVQVLSNHGIEAFINDGTGVFTEQAEELEMDIGDYYYWQPFFHDFNSDGFIDLYCNIDFDGNQLFLNSSTNVFDERSKSTNSDNAFNEMGITLGDIDNDGDFDIYSTNSENYLGNDVYNILLQRNDGSVHFNEVARSLGVEQGGWGWGATFFDYNNDGLIDLGATNGWYAEEPDQSKFWVQQADRSFADQSSEVGFDDLLNAVALISLDYDRDGDLDMIQTIKGYEGEQVPLRLLKNTISEPDLGNYLVVKPRMDGPNHFSLGAIVTAYMDGIPHPRIIHAGTSFYGQEPAEAYIGVGNYSIVDSLSITWPGGETSWWFDIDVDQIITLTDEAVVHRPIQLSAEQMGASVQISWKDISSNETSFILQRSTTEDFSNPMEIELAQNSTSVTDTELPDVSKVYYRLRAANAITSSRFTEVVDIDYTVLSTEKRLDEFRIYPNPTSSFIILESIRDVNTIRLYSISGIQITLSNRLEKLSKRMKLDLSGLRPGVYLLKVDGNAQRLIIK